MGKDLHLSNIQGRLPEAPRLTMDEYLQFVLYNLEHVVDPETLKKQIAEEKERRRYLPFRILK